MKKYLATLFASVVAISSAIADVLPKELEALSHYVGNWTARIDGNPKAKGTSNAQWTLDGRFLEQSQTLDLDPGVLPKLSCTTMLTYDSAKRAYRGWQFFSNGFTSTGEGVWDAEARAFTWTVVDPGSGNTTVTKVSFPQKGIERWSTTTTSREGKTLNSASGTNTRQGAK